MKELCAEAARRGILTVFDRAQTIRQIRVDVQDIACDAYVGCCRKWIARSATSLGEMRTFQRLLERNPPLDALTG